MRKTGVFLGILLLLAIASYHSLTKRQTKTRDELLEAIKVLENGMFKLEERIARLEARERPAAAPVLPPPSRPLAEMPLPSAPPAAASPSGRLVDQPVSENGSCLFATINTSTQLSSSLTWNESGGGKFVGDLAAGMIVEILSSTPLIWNDYPDEHALHVRVVEAPTAPQMENQSGYIELRRINHKRCNLGAEFEK